MATHKEHRHAAPRKGQLDQVLLTLGLWMIPMALFGYVAWQLTVATGNDPMDLLPAIEMWEIMLAVAAVIGGVALLVSWQRWRASHVREDVWENAPARSSRS